MCADTLPAAVVCAGSRQARQVFAPATAVAQYKDWPLVWSVQPLLQPQREPTQTLRQQLGMRSPPPLSAVLQHLQAVSFAAMEKAACSEGPACVVVCN